MVDIRKEELSAFEELINRQIGYSRHFDQDFICANGNYAKAMQLKRGRAQNNYIRLGLLKKIAEDQLLDSKEKLQLKKWQTTSCAVSLNLWYILNTPLSNWPICPGKTPSISN